jgi:predicted GNAT superfamily acetyltransferase
MTDVQIRSLSARDELAMLLELFDDVWALSPGSRPVSKDALLAIAHAGNPVLGAFAGTEMVAGSLGVLGSRGPGEVHVHSHMTGVRPGLQHAGLGRAIKRAQRQWAIDHGIGSIEWTFDPLVRRNAWFNLVVLGATVVEYLVDFYGPIDDAINGGDETDRLLVRWDVLAPRPGPVDVGHGRVVEVPDDIVAIRRADPASGRAWRLNLRAALGGLLAEGWTVAGLDTRARFVMHPPR